MAKGLIGGMTDYNHQSFSDILKDLDDKKKRTISFRDTIQHNVDQLIANSYWQTNVPFDFRNIVNYSLKHFNTSIEEFDDLSRDLNREVQDNHVLRLNKIANVADQINRDFGDIWGNKYDNKDYGTDNFDIVEAIYRDTRDMAVNLLDISNISLRLNDYVGKINPNMRKNNPWISGSFYLTVAIIVITGLATISNMVPWSLFPIIVVGGILLIGIIGVLQLKNDDKISDKSFTSLISETYKRLPLIGSKKKEKDK